MNQKPEKHEASISLLAQHVFNELRKSGTATWLGLPPPEEMERIQKEKAERGLKLKIHREQSKERRLADLKNKTRHVIQQNQQTATAE